MMTVNPKKRERFPWEDTSTIHRAEELTRAYGVHTLAFFGLAPENEHFLAPGGRGLVNYRLVDKVAVVLGDPLCAPEAREQVTESFLDFCASRHWSAAFYQASSEHLATYRALKLGTLKIGEEAIIDPQRFTLNGSALANVRTSCRRAEREGVRLHWYEGIPPTEVIHQLEQVSAAWLRHKSGNQEAEMGFSMGRLADLVSATERAERLAAIPAPLDGSQRTIPRLVTAVATEDSGVVCAFVTFTPIYGTLPGETDTTDDQIEMQGWGWTLDLMRRVPDAPPGVMELLLVRSIERFRSVGARCVSLGMVAWADSRREAHPVQHQLITFTTDRLGLLASRQTLSSFKQKFQPDWQSRYLIVSSPLAWPRAMRAVLHLRNYPRKFGNLLSTWWQFLRYCLVGGVNTLLDLLVLNILLWGFPTTNIYVLVAYNSIAYTSGSVSSFLFNKYWTFRHKQKTTLREVGRFALILLLEVLSSNGLVWLAGQALRPILNYGVNPELWGNASKLIAVVVGAVLSYLCMRFWIFATGPQDRSRPQGKCPTDSYRQEDLKRTPVPLEEQSKEQPTRKHHTQRTLSVVLPAYNEQEVIGQTIREAISTLSLWKLDFEVIVVDDGSKDLTGAILDTFAAEDSRVRIIHHPANQGYGAALVSGFEAAQNDLIFLMDADGQFDIRDLEKFFPSLDTYDAVLGYRVKRQDSWMRRFNARVWKRLVGLAFGIHVHDVDCAFKLYPADFFRTHRLQSRGAMINAEILYKFTQAGYTYTQVGVRHLARQAGRATGAKPAVILRALHELFTYAWKWRREEGPMRSKRS